MVTQSRWDLGQAEHCDRKPVAEEIAHLMVVIKQRDKNWEEWGSQQSLQQHAPCLNSSPEP